MARGYIIHTPDEIRRIRRAAEMTARVRDALAAAVRPGMSTKELDDVAGDLIRSVGGTSAFLGYAGYPGNVCISVNEEVVHGIGRPDRIIGEDDIVSLDVGVAFDGGVGDTAVTVGFGKLPETIERLLNGTRAALEAGIMAAVAGNYVRDISMAVERTAKHYHLGIVRDYVGHGVGTHLHEPPEVPNFSGFGKGPRLVPGMVLAIEPMLNLGTGRVITDRIDHWTVRTADGEPSAHFEHSVLITENEPEILTWQKMM